MGNEWRLSQTSESCFLSQSIESMDSEIREKALTLGAFELVCSEGGAAVSRTVVRVTSTLDEALDAKQMSLRTDGRRPVRLRPHRPGGRALRYVEFNGSQADAQMLCQALAAGSAIEAVFHVGLLSRIRGLITVEGFSEQLSAFKACVDQLQGV